MNDIKKSKLKETNYEAFIQIHIDDKEKSIEDYQHISSNSTEIIDWQCHNNKEHIWSTQAYNRGTVENDLGCPYCLNQHLYEEVPILLLHKRRWNGMREYVYSIWHCNKCYSVWEINKFDTLHFKSTCLNCDIGIVIETLEETYPHLAKEWDDESNLITSKRVNIEYPFDITWKCRSCNQLWVSTLYDRVEERLHCPYCSGKLPMPNENSFAALYPEYLNEWNWELNQKTGRDPAKIFPTYKYIINWICIECSFPYSTTIQERLTNINCCPNCNSNNPIDKENYDRIKEELYNSSDKDYIYPNSKKQITWRCNCCDMLWS